MEKLAYSIDELTEVAPVGRTKIYQDISSGALKARKHGRRTIILNPDAHSWLAALPDYPRSATA